MRFLLGEAEETPSIQPPLIFFCSYNKMSVANILDPVTGQILPAYIPSGAGEFVTNPMAASLDCGGFDLTDCDDITCSNIISKSHDVTDGAGTVQGSFTFGTTPLGTGIQLQGTGANLLVAQNIKAGDSLIGQEVDTTLVNLPAGDDTGLTFASVTNELYVRYEDGVGLNVTASSGTANLTTTGTVQGSLLNSTGNITATGTIVPSQWNAYPQIAVGTTVSWSNPATFVDLLTLPSVPAGIYLANVEIELVNPTHSNLITLQYILSDAQPHTVITQNEDMWAGDVGSGNISVGVFSFIMIQPASGSIAIQLSGTLNAGQTCNFTCGSVGILRLR